MSIQLQSSIETTQAHEAIEAAKLASVIMLNIKIFNIKTLNIKIFNIKIFNIKTLNIKILNIKILNLKILNIKTLIFSFAVDFQIPIFQILNEVLLMFYKMFPFYEVFKIFLDRRYY